MFAKGDKWVFDEGITDRVVNKFEVACRRVGASVSKVTIINEDGSTMSVC